MLVCAIDHEMLVRCEASALHRCVELFQRVDPDLAVPNSTWTAHDVAAHLVNLAGRYLSPDRKLAGTQRELREMNDQEIAEFDSASMGELVGRLRSRNAKYNVFWPEQALDQTFPYRAGFPLDAGNLRSNWITELQIHGRDVAVAAGEEWELDDVSSLLTLRLLAHVLPRYLSVAGAADYQLIIAPVGGMPFSLVIEDGTAQTQAKADDGADRLLGPPAALALLLYGRIGITEARELGVQVNGDTGRVQALLDRLEKP